METLRCFKSGIRFTVSGQGKYKQKDIKREKTNLSCVTDKYSTCCYMYISKYL
jgi:hypothetical protein